MRGRRAGTAAGRTAGRLAGAVLAAALLTGCGADEPSEEENAAAVQGVLEQALVLDEDVVGVRGGYEGDGAVVVELVVPTSVGPREREDLLDRAEELVWGSRVAPLTALEARVLELDAAPDAAPLLERTYDGPAGLARLQERLGERDAG